MTNLQSLYNDDRFKDIIFTTDTFGVFKAHRCILAVSNVEFFKTMLTSSFEDANKKEVHLRDCSNGAVQIALKWAYEIKVVLQEEELEEIFEASDKFACPSIINSISSEICRVENGKYEFANQASIYAPKYDSIVSEFPLSVQGYLSYMTKYGSVEDNVDFIKYALTTCKITMETRIKELIPHLEVYEPNNYGYKIIITALLERLDYFHLNTSAIIRLLIVNKFLQASEITKISLYDRDCLHVLQNYPLKIGRYITDEEYVKLISIHGEDYEHLTVITTKTVYDDHNSYYIHDDIIGETHTTTHQPNQLLGELKAGDHTEAKQNAMARILAKVAQQNSVSTNIQNINMGEIIEEGGIKYLISKKYVLYDQW